MRVGVQSSGGGDLTPSPREPIAIVGIGCRFPGDADSPLAFWRMLCEGLDAVGPLPEDRFPSATFDATHPGAPGQIAAREGGFLRHVDGFDAGFFGISPREAMTMDPQQRLLLETAWEAIEDAGMTRQQLAGSRTGTYVGLWTSDYESLAYADPESIDLYATTGTGRYAASGRLAYAFDLRGPTLTVDTACSSSLVALHLAVQALRSGELAMALVGAANLILQPPVSIGYARSRMLSRDARCRFGDAAASGYVRSEGCGVVLLKPLSRARADGDRIYAIVRGSAINNDGGSAGSLVAPSGDEQANMLRAAYADAGISPGMVSYVEAHGTGTPVGDPIELRALGSVLGEGRPLGQRCPVGSVKTNIGHTEAASGMAGLIKAALMLSHQQIPPSLHLRTPNPSIPWDSLPLEIPQTARPLQAMDGRRVVGVNSFGVTGTNAHVVLESVPDLVADSPSPSASKGTATRAQLLVLSAGSPAALNVLASAMHEQLADMPVSFDVLCQSAAQRRTPLAARLAVVASDVASAREALAAAAADAIHPSLIRGNAAGEAPRVAFVFPGQGSQWLGMARDLLEEEPVFAEAMARCDAAVRAETGWSVLDELRASTETSRLAEIDVVQPTLFAVQYALAALWTSWGIRPSAVVGHSMGEVAAAAHAGALSLEDAAAVICRRSRLLRRVRGQGAMLVVELSVDDARARLAGVEHLVSVAVSNGPRSTVLAGDTAALRDIETQLQSEGIYCKRIQVDVASHSPQVDVLLDDLRQSLAHLSPRASEVPLVSTVEGAPIDGAVLDAQYWVRNLREPVLFARVVERLLDEGITAFVEVSPHPALLPSMAQMIQARGGTVRALPSLRRGEPGRAAMLQSLGALFVAGADLDWARVSTASARPIDFPRYPWQRERYWLSPASRDATVARGGHRWLGRSTAHAGQPGTVTWHSTLDLRRMPWLGDHKVGDSILLPATGALELLLAAGEASAEGSFTAHDFTMYEALPLRHDKARRVQVVVEPRPAGGSEARLYVASEEQLGQEAWQLVASARLDGAAPDAPPADMPADMPGALGDAAASISVHDAAMRMRALEYGPAFRRLASVGGGNGEVFGHLASPGAHVDRRVVWLDAALQLALAALPAETATDTYLPVRMARVELHRPLPAEGVWAIATADAASVPGRPSFDISLRDAEGALLVRLVGATFAPLPSAAGAATSTRFDIRWESLPRAVAATEDAGTWLLWSEGNDHASLVDALRAAGDRVLRVVPASHAAADDVDVLPFDATDSAATSACVAAARAQAGVGWRGVVYLASPVTDAPAGIDVPVVGARAWQVVQVARALADGEPGGRLWLVTRGAQMPDGGAADAGQATLWGIGRVIAAEMPRLRCTNIDVGTDVLDATSLVTELRAGVSGDAEDQVWLRPDVRCVPRLTPRDAGAEPARRRRRLAEGEAFALVVPERGRFESMRLRARSREAPLPGTVEIRVSSAGLNFRDVLEVMGGVPGVGTGPYPNIGFECAGVVSAVGDGVDGLAVGDEVVAITSSYEHTSCFASHVVLPAAFVMRRPSWLTAEQAAGLPVVYVTAHFALNDLARMRRGERVLVHAAAGGVGLAAVHLCQRVGAEVYATAGSPEKRALLRAMGVAHVFDSRTLAFADEIRAATNGLGVDIVLNSLAGDAIPLSLDLLAPGGRFLEIGKRDIYGNAQLGLLPFQRNLSFHAIDIARLTTDDPARAAGLFRDAMALVVQREVPPLPVLSRPASEADESFRVMARGHHVGKLVLSFAETPGAVETEDGAAVQASGTYVITGGLGGLGLAVARRLVAEGARHLALLGRSVPTDDAQETIAALRRDGCTVAAVQADVADRASLDAALAEVRRALPPIRGVYHAAGVLADATVETMTREQLNRAFAPKVAGTRYLHELTVADPVDRFVLFGSVSAVIGLAGQANYAGANAALDAFATWRRSHGLPALCIAWGPWADIGLAAAESHRGERLAAEGLRSLAPDDGLSILAQAIRSDETHLVAMRFDARAWAAARRAVPPLLLAMAEGALPSESAARMPDQLVAMDTTERRRHLENVIREQLALVLRIAPARIDRLQSFRGLGVDSLMALELRTRLESLTGLTLSATMAWSHPSVMALAEHLATRLGVALTNAAEERAPASGSAAFEPRQSTVAQASARDTASREGSGDDVSAQLAAEIAAIERLLASDTGEAS